MTQPRPNSSAHAEAPAIPNDIDLVVKNALREDLGGGDLTASLVPADAVGKARIISREQAVVAGRPWVDKVFECLGGEVSVNWQVSEGEKVKDNQVLCSLTGPARALLSGERTALNFLQTLSGTATLARRYAERVKGTKARVLDTRKTLPGLRTAQKYAVAVGGCANHRVGLYDGILIKENHIMAAGSISRAVAAARQLQAGVPIQVECETMDEVADALEAGADMLLLDNFSLPLLQKAVNLNRNNEINMRRARMGLERALLEGSGNVSLNTVRAIAETGVDRISVGGITKHVTAIDLSMRFDVELPA